ncbi:MAG TPA: AAA family ATPase [Syntrophales bacterium]|nr:AAA family ATPase [Syntrophales bacterium]HPI55822.1 AAA family ATPase [Syntrophales bacterium]HPN23687.1 AAA family ATPase [Syntrophales bacterium]HQM27788.1 AAA family ATPase [Syntrophales bacterium]
MKKLIVASVHENAGKTSIIVGLCKVLNRKFGYLKPFGYRILYRKKRLWDYDAALMTNLFGLDESPSDMSIGFQHSKMSFMLDEVTARERLQEIMQQAGKDRDVLFLEAGKDLVYGASVNLDALSLLQYADAGLMMLVGGDEYTIMDEIAFIRKHMDIRDPRFKGVIINKISNPDDFRDIHLPQIQKMGIRVLGSLPYCQELSFLSLNYLVEQIFAKTLAGEDDLDREVGGLYVETVCSSDVMKDPLFKDKNKLVITSGNSADVIVAALESGSAGIIVADNIIPADNLIAMAQERHIPLLLVSSSVHALAKQVEGFDPLLTPRDKNKIALLTDLVKTHVDIGALMG